MSNKLLATIIAFIFCSAATNAQNVNDAESVFQQIKQYINEKNTHGIYMLSSDAYKAMVPEAGLNDFFQQQIFPLGSIKETSLIRHSADTSYYKLTYDAIKLEFSFILNNKRQYEYLLFTPYKEPVTLKTETAATSNPMKSETDKAVDDVARPYMQKGNTVGLCIGVWKDGKQSLYGYGETEKASKRIPDESSIFEIGSITKTFTASLLAYYVNEGRINLDDPITKYLPDSVAANEELRKVKVVNLSNHTSGLGPLPDNFATYSTEMQNPYVHYNKAMFFSSLKTCKLKTVPGDSYAYSNQAVALLGLILEKVSGKSYEAMVKEIITKPLHMPNTEQHLTQKQEKDFLKVYNEEGMQTPAWDFDAMVACGGLRSTLSDLLIYARNNIKCDDKKLSKAFKLAQQVTYDKNPKVALGWHLIVKDNRTWYWHNGGTGGSRSMLIFDAEKNIAVVVLSNCNESVDEVGANLMKALD